MAVFQLAFYVVAFSNEKWSEMSRALQFSNVTLKKDKGKNFAKEFTIPFLFLQLFIKK